MVPNHFKSVFSFDGGSWEASDDVIPGLVKLKWTVEVGRRGALLYLLAGLLVQIGKPEQKLGSAARKPCLRFFAAPNVSKRVAVEQKELMTLRSPTERAWPIFFYFGSAERSDRFIVFLALKNTAV